MSSVDLLLLLLLLLSMVSGFGRRGIWGLVVIGNLESLEVVTAKQIEGVCN